jgi:hypothetical protein
MYFTQKDDSEIIFARQQMASSRTSMHRQIELIETTVQMLTHAQQPVPAPKKKSRQRTEEELPRDDYSDEQGEPNDDEDEDSESQVLKDDSSHSASEGSEEYESEKEESD